MKELEIEKNRGKIKVDEKTFVNIGTDVNISFHIANFIAYC